MSFLQYCMTSKAAWKKIAANSSEHLEITGKNVNTADFKSVQMF